MSESNPSSHSNLVELARAGNKEAFTTLFEKHQLGIYGFLAGLVGNSEDAYDLAQQTFFKAWQELVHLREASKFTAWLYRIARNLAYDQGRRRKHIIWVSFGNLDDADTIFQGPDPAEQLAQKDLIKAILAQLPLKYCECLLLKIEGGLSHRQIAEIVGISEESVSTYVSTARKLFRHLYHQQNLTYSISTGKEVPLDE